MEGDGLTKRQDVRGAALFRGGRKKTGPNFCNRVTAAGEKRASPRGTASPQGAHAAGAFPAVA